MVTDMQQKLIKDYCKHLFRDTTLSEILAETTFKQIESGLLTFQDWAAHALAKHSLHEDLRKRIEESILSS